MFVDECTVSVRAGRGGNGSRSMHSEPFKPRGGPDGGNGGKGGDIVFRVSTRLRDLSPLTDHPHLIAADGGAGRSSNRAGASGRDLVVGVPDGTIVKDELGLLADLLGEGSEFVVARGGRGGRGNAAFVGPGNRAPRGAEPGEQGEERRLRVELRTVADVGLVGLPNAGKSTLLSRLTAARPKIADYPFTTLSPNLGVSDTDPRFVVADIPGLIEGAHQGKGLGHRFLRHVMRCPALILVVDLAGEDPVSDLASLRGELGAFDPALAARPAVVVGAKADLVEDPAGRAASLGQAALAVSAITGEGMDDLRGRLAGLVSEAEVPERKPFVVLRPARPPFVVTRERDGVFRVAGRNVERWVGDTDMDDPQQVESLQRRLVKAGVERKLAAAGARRGDEVLISGTAFEFIPEGETA